LENNNQTQKRPNYSSWQTSFCQAKMSKQKAFTLIEIMVVILIVGALASLVLVASKSVRNKTKDAAINASLTHLKKAAELHFDDDYTYSGFCNTDNAQRTADSVADKGSQLFCDSDAISVWAACAQMKQDATKFYCIDNTESIIEIIGTCDATAIAGGACISTCPNLTCDIAEGENCNNCSEDCGNCCPNGLCDFGETSAPSCPDGFCDGAGGENCNTCSADCGNCCPNGLCDFGETPITCPADCPTGGLISHWKFDGNANDSEVAANHGILVGAGATITYDAARDYDATTTGEVLNLNGVVGNYVDIDNVANDIQTGDFSVSFWFKPAVTFQAGAATSQTLFRLGDAPSLNDIRVQLTASDGRIRFYHYTGSGWQIATTSQNSWIAGTWYHVVVVLGDGIYINSVQDGTNLDSNRGAVYALKAYVGREASNSNYFNGRIDDVMVYDDALSLAEIQQIYNDQGSVVIAEQTILFDDFEAEAVSSPPSSLVPPTTPDWEDDGISEAWHVLSGSTPSSGTGPTTGAGGTAKYIYVEVSNYAAYGCYTAGETAIVESSVINFDNYTGEYITWWTSMYGANIGTLKLEENTTGSWVELWSLSGDQGTDWFEIPSVDLSGLTGTGELRFHYTCAGGFQGDVAIDEIGIYGF
jgi:prepilin-type N-terminal cleavage/methylation domain-containing protein